MTIYMEHNDIIIVVSLSVVTKFGNIIDDPFLSRVRKFTRKNNIVSHYVCVSGSR